MRALFVVIFCQKSATFENCQEGASQAILFLFFSWVLVQDKQCKVMRLFGFCFCGRFFVEREEGSFHIFCFRNLVCLGTGKLALRKQACGSVAAQSGPGFAHDPNRN